MNRNHFACLTISILAASPGVLAQNGISQTEFEYNASPYVDCVGERLDVTLNVTLRTHFIETPSGHTHLVDNWTFDGDATGQSSGHTWYVHGVGPYRENGRGLQGTGSLNVNVTFEPLDGQQKIKEKQEFNFVVDANGVVRIEGGDTKFRCVGN